ncbi:DUF4097 domain-containing protein [Cesiribacter sp. SM1]|uniref:DUF4097 domain-containing protein n=1 Tax=Cesiribacter sp. SM1 TaxID=2861196 RepID=UPI001CD38977|nr:DUF4097 domain-containing protein [Cesiribacter sp. SM1]
MKKQLFFLLLALAPLCLQAQQVVNERWPLPANKPVNLKLDHASSIALRGWDKPEVEIKAVVQINGGRDNDAFKLTGTDAAAGLQITSLVDEEQLSGSSAEDCNGSQSIWRYDSDNVNRNICLEISFEVWLPHSAVVKLETISGDVTATNLRGSLDLKSISGFIDVSMAPAQQAELTMKSVTGELYTDLDLQILNKKDEIPIVGYEMKGKLGNGGTPVRLETISSNIYLRKE